jgi:hypothetical protein
MQQAFVAVTKKICLGVAALKSYGNQIKNEKIQTPRKIMLLQTCMFNNAEPATN